MTSTRVLVVALVLATGLAKAEHNGADWVAFETAAGVRASDGSSVYVAFLPTQQCRPRVSVALHPAASAGSGLDHRDVSNLWVTLRIDGNLPWRTNRASIYAADGVLRAAIDDLHSELIAELSAGQRLDLGHTTAPLHGAGEALEAARHACHLALEDSRPLPEAGVPRVALTP